MNAAREAEENSPGILSGHWILSKSNLELYLIATRLHLEGSIVELPADTSREVLQKTIYDYFCVIDPLLKGFNFDFKIYLANDHSGKNQDLKLNLDNSSEFYTPPITQLEISPNKVKDSIVDSGFEVTVNNNFKFLAKDDSELAKSDEVVLSPRKKKNKSESDVIVEKIKETVADFDSLVQPVGNYSSFVQNFRKLDIKKDKEVKRLKSKQRKSKLGTVKRSQEFLQHFRKLRFDFDCFDFFGNYTLSETFEEPKLWQFDMATHQRPSTYSHGLNEDIKVFLDTFENECEAFGWNNDEIKLKKIRIAFKDAAQIIFNSDVRDSPDLLDNENHATWDNMKNKLEAVFTKTKPILKQTLRGRKYEGDNDFHEYKIFVTRTLKEMNPNVSEEKIILKILDGMPFAERDFIYRLFPENLRELDEAFGKWLKYKNNLSRNKEQFMIAEMERIKNDVENLKIGSSSKNVNAVSLDTGSSDESTVLDKNFDKIVNAVSKAVVKQFENKNKNQDMVQVASISGNKNDNSGRNRNNNGNYNKKDRFEADSDKNRANGGGDRNFESSDRHYNGNYRNFDRNNRNFEGDNRNFDRNNRYNGNFGNFRRNFNNSGRYFGNFDGRNRYPPNGFNGNRNSDNFGRRFNDNFNDYRNYNYGFYTRQEGFHPFNTYTNRFLPPMPFPIPQMPQVQNNMPAITYDSNSRNNNNFSNNNSRNVSNNPNF